MSASWLYDVNIWILGAGSIVVFLACAAAGQWMGHRFRSEESDSALSVITATQAATLGMFAILIGFSFSMAMSLFEQRRTLLLDEANAIGTTVLRAQMLPPPYAVEANRLLREYVGVRLSFHRDSDDETKFAQAMLSSSYAFTRT